MRRSSTNHLNDHNDAPEIYKVSPQLVVARQDAIHKLKAATVPAVGRMLLWP